MHAMAIIEYLADATPKQLPGQNGALTVRASSSHRGDFLHESLAAIEAVRQRGERCSRATLSCDGRSDWSAMHCRALISRALLTILEPDGVLTLQAPPGALDMRVPLVALADSLEGFCGPFGAKIRTSFRETRKPAREQRASA